MCVIYKYYKFRIHSSTTWNKIKFHWLQLEREREVEEEEAEEEEEEEESSDEENETPEEAVQEEGLQEYEPEQEFQGGTVTRYYIHFFIHFIYSFILFIYLCIFAKSYKAVEEAFVL